jgi:hypothetical protein
MIRVFIGWSGQRGEEAATVIYKWLPTVIQLARPFMSTEEIRKGADWSSVIKENLVNCRFGILRMTSEALDSKWIHYEAGALTGHVEKNLVTPLLLGISDGDLTPPIGHLQTTKLDRKDMWRLVKSINEQLQDDKLDESVLKVVFDGSWTGLETDLTPLMSPRVGEGAAPQKRSTEEILEEVLALTREQARNSAGLIGARYLTPTLGQTVVTPAGTLGVRYSGSARIVPVSFAVSDKILVSDEVTGPLSTLSGD